jgi:hypothetical protein
VLASHSVSLSPIEERGKRIEGMGLKKLMGVRIKKWK